jgi:hypothetical protein
MPRRLERVLGLGNRLAIIGGPGCGKTTVQPHMAWALASSLLAGEPEPARSRRLTMAPGELPLPSSCRWPVRAPPAPLPAGAGALHLAPPSAAKRPSTCRPTSSSACSGMGNVILLPTDSTVANESERGPPVGAFVASRSAMRVVVTCRTIAYRSGGTALGADFRDRRAGWTTAAHRADGARLRLYSSAGQRAPHDKS